MDTNGLPTPGPWMQGKTHRTPVTKKWSAEHIANNDRIERRIVVAGAWPGRRIGIFEREEDAQLAAAAPDLLAALEGVIRVADRATVEFDAARAAIAKATAPAVES